VFDLSGSANAAIAEDGGLKTRRRKASVEPKSSLDLSEWDVKAM
jgi:hypothetical protein